MHGSIADGLIEAYFLCDPDLVKDSNLQCTLCARMLELSHIELRERNLSMPLKIRMHTDNAAGEGKNNTVMHFCGQMTSSHCVSGVSLTMFRVGHSHDKQDERFSNALVHL